MTPPHPLPDPTLAKNGFALGFLARSPMEIADRAQTFTPRQPDALGGLLAGALIAHPDCMQTGSDELRTVASVWTEACARLDETERIITGTWIRAAMEYGCETDPQRLHRFKTFSLRASESPGYTDPERDEHWSNSELRLPLMSRADGAFDLCIRSLEAFQIDLSTPSSNPTTRRPPTL